MQYTSVKTFLVIDHVYYTEIMLFCSVLENSLWLCKYLLFSSYINQALYRTSVFRILRGTPNY